MQKTFCDGCDEEIQFDANKVATGGARTNLNIRAACGTDRELGQFAQDGLDLCNRCIDHMKRAINPKTWPRAAKSQ